MPRNVRNFWVEIQADGYRHSVALGPKARDGGFSMRIFQRDKGEVREVLSVEGRAVLVPSIPNRTRLLLDVANPHSGSRLNVTTDR